MHFHWTWRSTIRATREIPPIDSDDLICHLNRFRLSRGGTIVPDSRGVLYSPFSAVKFNGSVMSRHTVLCRFYTSDYYVPIRVYALPVGVVLLSCEALWVTGYDRFWRDLYIFSSFVLSSFDIVESDERNQQKIVMDMWIRRIRFCVRFKWQQRTMAVQSWFSVVERIFNICHVRFIFIAQFFNSWELLVVDSDNEKSNWPIV